MQPALPPVESGVPLASSPLGSECDGDQSNADFHSLDEDDAEDDDDRILETGILDTYRKPSVAPLGHYHSLGHPSGRCHGDVCAEGGSATVDGLAGLPGNTSKETDGSACSRPALVSTGHHVVENGVSNGKSCRRCYVATGSCSKSLQRASQQQQRRSQADCCCGVLSCPHSDHGRVVDAAGICLRTRVGQSPRAVTLSDRVSDLWSRRCCCCCNRGSRRMLPNEKVLMGSSLRRSTHSGSPVTHGAKELGARLLGGAKIILRSGKSAAAAAAMETYRHQVGGHSQFLKPPDSSKVFKPYSSTECRFYEALERLGRSTTDSNPLHVLKQFVPKYFGVTSIQMHLTAPGRSTCGISRISSASGRHVGEPGSVHGRDAAISAARPSAMPQSPATPALTVAASRGRCSACRSSRCEDGCRRCWDVKGEPDSASHHSGISDTDATSGSTSKVGCLSCTSSISSSDSEFTNVSSRSHHHKHQGEFAAPNYHSTGASSSSSDIDSSHNSFEATCHASWSRGTRRNCSHRTAIIEHLGGSGRGQHSRARFQATRGCRDWTASRGSCSRCGDIRWAGESSAPEIVKGACTDQTTAMIRGGEAVWSTGAGNSDNSSRPELRRGESRGSNQVVHGVTQTAAQRNCCVDTEAFRAQQQQVLHAFGGNITALLRSKTNPGLAAAAVHRSRSVDRTLSSSGKWHRRAKMAPRGTSPSDATSESKTTTLGFSERGIGSSRLASTSSRLPRGHDSSQRHCGDDGGAAGVVLKYIVLEDLVYRYKKPCVMDLKLGSRQRKVGASPEKEKQQIAKSLNSTSRHFGFRFCGCQFYDKSKNILCYRDKYWGRDLTGDKILECLDQWFWNGFEIYRELIKPLINSLRILRNCIAQLKHYRFWSSSLLCVYDGGLSDPKARIRSLDVRIIDFGNSIVVRDAPPEPDFECLLGLDSLIGLLSILAKQWTAGSASDFGRVSLRPLAPSCGCRNGIGAGRRTGEPSGKGALHVVRQPLASQGSVVTISTSETQTRFLQHRCPAPERLNGNHAQHNWCDNGCSSPTKTDNASAAHSHSACALNACCNSVTVARSPDADSVFSGRQVTVDVERCPRVRSSGCVAAVSRCSTDEGTNMVQPLTSPSAVGHTVARTVSSVSTALPLPQCELAESSASIPQRPSSTSRASSTQDIVAPGVFGSWTPLLPGSKNEYTTNPHLHINLEGECRGTPPKMSPANHSGSDVFPSGLNDTANALPAGQIAIIEPGYRLHGGVAATLADSRNQNPLAEAELSVDPTNDYRHYNPSNNDCKVVPAVAEVVTSSSSPRAIMCSGGIIMSSKSWPTLWVPDIVTVATAGSFASSEAKHGSVHQRSQGTNDSTGAFIDRRQFGRDNSILAEQRWTCNIADRLVDRSASLPPPQLIRRTEPPRA